MEIDRDTSQVSYVIPARTITGSPAQILDEIDDMMDALRLVRETVIARAPKPARPPVRSWRERLLGALRFPSHHAEPSSNR